MTKGTTSQGPRNTKTHTLCRRCGRQSFHRQHKICGACGYPRAKTRRCIIYIKFFKMMDGDAKLDQEKDKAQVE